MAFTATQTKGDVIFADFTDQVYSIVRKHYGFDYLSISDEPCNESHQLHFTFDKTESEMVNAIIEESKSIDFVFNAWTQDINQFGYIGLTFDLNEDKEVVNKHR